MQENKTDDFIDEADLPEPALIRYAAIPDERCETCHGANRCILIQNHEGAHVMGTPKWEREAMRAARVEREKRAAERDRQRAEDSIRSDENTMTLRYTTWLARDLEVEVGMTAAVLEAVSALTPAATEQEIRVAELSALLKFRQEGLAAMCEALPAVREKAIAALQRDQDDEEPGWYSTASLVGMLALPLLGSWLSRAKPTGKP